MVSGANKQYEVSCSVLMYVTLKMEVLLIIAACSAYIYSYYITKTYTYTFYIKYTKETQVFNLHSCPKQKKGDITSVDTVTIFHEGDQDLSLLMLCMLVTFL